MKKSNKVVTKKIDARQSTGISMLVISAVLFILCIFPSFLGIGRFFQGLLGVMCYPIFVLLFLIGTALTLKMNYTFNKKFTSFLVLSIISILCLMHTIFTSDALMNQTRSFSNFGEYLSLCYKMKNGITVGGVLLGAIVFFFRALIGLGASYVVFAVVGTIFVGLVIDYIIYSKKQGRSPRLLEKKEPTQTSFATQSETDQLYSFSNDDKIDQQSEQEYQELLAKISEEKPVVEESSENPVIFETTFEKTQPVENVAKETQPSDFTQSEPMRATDYAESVQSIKTYSDKKTFYDNNKYDRGAYGNAGTFEQRSETSSERDKARSLLFGTATTSQKAERAESDQPKTAREVLFGNKNEPAIPNIFDRSSKDRDDWRKQYASKTLQFRDEDTSAKIPPADNSEEQISSPADQGIVNTSWGSYKPTKMEHTSVGNRVNDVSQSDRRASFNRQFAEDNAPSQNVFDRDHTSPQSASDNQGFSQSVSQQREARFERNTISNINQTTGETDGAISNTEFGSRLTRTDRRVRSEDLLADASSLGISAKEPQTQAFTNILQNNRVESRVGRDVDKPAGQKPSKVEKLSFENQLNREYKKPSTNLLRVTKEVSVDYSAEYKQKSATLESTLETFKIPAKVINVVRGPKVTRYELSMPIGIPVSRVLSYEKDISMNLASKNGIRIEAPIPGKNAFGVEVANDITSMVGLRELLESPEFQAFKGPLPVAIGRNISGEVIIKSLPKMVHCLVAGSTGSGKSVFLHSLIMSLMFKHSPDELRFIMIDPKRVEFSRYNRMPHLMLPEVVTDCTKAVNALNWAVKEMERRFQLLMTNECQKIDQYNQLDKIRKGEEKRLPYLIIIVDELAELMGIAKKDVEGKIQRITQLGRACGIHMVVATQRPSVDVVTGVIKNNLPTRIAFSLSSYVDSKTILDEAGAEKLLGEGDMLFSGQDSNQKLRLQGAYVSDEEIKAVLDYIKENNVSEYDEEVQNSIYAEPETDETPDDDDNKGPNEDRMDEYMPQALKLVMKNGKASISMIQRRFSVGYARAARIIDQMETRGFIDGGTGNKPRDVKITIAEYNELFGDFDAEN